MKILKFLCFGIFFSACVAAMISDRRIESSEDPESRQEPIIPEQGNPDFEALYRATEESFSNRLPVGRRGGISVESKTQRDEPSRSEQN